MISLINLKMTKRKDFTEEEVRKARKELRNQQNKY